jgi:multiple sugar transport system permease protein
MKIEAPTVNLDKAPKVINFSDLIIKSAVNLFLLFLAAVWIFPFYWAVINSFKTEQAMFALPPQLWPVNPTLMNYWELFRKTHSLVWTTNSFTVSIITMASVCLISGLAGYAFAKLRFRGRDLIFYIMISAMMLPKYVLLVPLFRLMKSLNWFDTYAGLIVPELAVPFGVFMMRQFIKSIPDELIEAAKVDGCNQLVIFAYIITPLLKPALAALAIFTFVRSWNDYMWQLIVTKSELMKTLPLGIAGLKQENMVQYGQVMAGAMLSALPMIIIFILFQKYFTKGLTLGAVKG